jgi:hypothetical protein
MPLVHLLERALDDGAEDVHVDVVEAADVETGYAGVLVVIAAEADDARPPHDRFSPVTCFIIEVRAVAARRLRSSSSPFTNVWTLTFVGTILASLLDRTTSRGRYDFRWGE